MFCPISSQYQNANIVKVMPFEDGGLQDWSQCLLLRAPKLATPHVATSQGIFKEAKSATLATQTSDKLRGLWLSEPQLVRKGLPLASGRNESWALHGAAAPAVLSARLLPQSRPGKSTQNVWGGFEWSGQQGALFLWRPWAPVQAIFFTKRVTTQPWAGWNVDTKDTAIKIPKMAGTPISRWSLVLTHSHFCLASILLPDVA